MKIITTFLIIFYCFFSANLIANTSDAYPITVPNCTGMLQVDELHSIYWEESGNPSGVPVIFLHGGPGVGLNHSNYHFFFDPNHYRIIAFDQRGCGKSLPQGCLQRNTTWDLVEDINKLRDHLSIDRCILFGGSWGATLALVYAIKYPENVLGLILRGIFLSRQDEYDWFYKEGASHLAPKGWQIFINQIPLEKRDDLIAAYHDHLNCGSYWKETYAAAAWVLWEFANIQSTPDRRLNMLLNFKLLFPVFAVLFANQNKVQARIENHYFYNRCFFDSDNWILENIHKIQDIPGFIIQGECDQICPWKNAEELHVNWPSSNFLLIPNAGHASTEPETLKALIAATEDFKTL